MNFDFLQQKSTLALLGAALFLIGIGVGYFVFADRSGPYTSVRETTTNYKFIAPLLFVKTPEEDSFPQYRPLKDAITRLADRFTSEGKVSDISIYYRNLNTSQWVGVDVEKRFAPASMLKVVTLMATLREVEEKPSLLSARVTLPGPDKLPAVEQDEYAPKNPLLPTHTYSVQELLEHLIVDSDNIADYALRTIVGEQKTNEIYDDLELPRPGSDEGYTSQEYSRLFRTLYNATYLSHPLSEQVLELLSRTTFTEGIVSGVPEKTRVSHKFGIRTTLNSDGTTDRELHDCGIVYFPEHPYFLCVMTHGTEFSVLEDVLKEVSKTVWDEVSTLH